MPHPRTRPQIEAEFKTWLRETATRQGLTQVDVRDRFPMQQPHPRTVAGWFGGYATPRYAEFVALCVVLGELPPALKGLCPSVA